MAILHGHYDHDFHAGIRGDGRPHETKRIFVAGRIIFSFTGLLTYVDSMEQRHGACVSESAFVQY